MPKKKKEDKAEGADEENTRIAIVNLDKCRPKKCRQECKRNCPVVRMGKMCIEVLPTSKSTYISEELCIGCGICVKKCPFNALNIINLPKNLGSETTHRYSANSFKLHRLPMPRKGQVLGLVGTNGIGKSTALKILAGKMKPNLGQFDSPPDWEDILKYFRGSELQNYFTLVLEDRMKAIIKPQYVDHIPRAVKGQVGQIMKAKNEAGDEAKLAKILSSLQLNHVLDRDVDVLSGGELQRFAIAVVAIQTADVYMFDEPSSYLDVKQRMAASIVIREQLHIGGKEKYVIVVEHDLAVLDYMSDYVCCLYGSPSNYGVVTMPFSVREGINIFLAGYVPTENLRFRPEALTFRVAQGADDRGGEVGDALHQYIYPHMTKTLRPKKAVTERKPFILHVEGGSFTDSEIIVMLGENGCGKTTFIRMMAGLLKSDEEAAAQEEFGEHSREAMACGVPRLGVSYKPQKISPKFPGTVRELFHKKIRSQYMHPQFISDVMRPLNMDDIIDQEVTNLSGGELQRTAICLCLGQPAVIYLIDEPSAYLDSEQRIHCGKVIKRFIMHAKKTAFIVEHDFIMATYLADRVIVYDGNPGVETYARSPQGLLSGMNRFLALLEITFRRDPENYRPRINKFESQMDMSQKASGDYFFLEEE
jgi:ATP-binding cassette, sub-family E, member 1